MDFSTLARRDLQALCKKNKIPANITTVAMIDALNALDSVEGIEEFSQSPVESPEKNVAAQKTVPRTTRKKTVIEEANNDVAEAPATRRKEAIPETPAAAPAISTRRVTRRIAGDVEEANNVVSEAPATRRKIAIPDTPAAAPATSSRRKIEEKEDVKEVEGIEEFSQSQKTVPQTSSKTAIPITPAAARATSTRRVTRRVAGDVEQANNVVAEAPVARRKIAIPETPAAASATSSRRKVEEKEDVKEVEETSSKTSNQKKPVNEESKTSLTSTRTRRKITVSETPAGAPATSTRRKIVEKEDVKEKSVTAKRATRRSARVPDKLSPVKSESGKAIKIDSFSEEDLVEEHKEDLNEDLGNAELSGVDLQTTPEDGLEEICNSQDVTLETVKDLNDAVEEKSGDNNNEEDEMKEQLEEAVKDLNDAVEEKSGGNNNNEEDEMKEGAVKDLNDAVEEKSGDNNNNEEDEMKEQLEGAVKDLNDAVEEKSGDNNNEEVADVPVDSYVTVLEEEHPNKSIENDGEDNKVDDDSKKNEEVVHEECAATDPLPSENLGKKLDMQNEEDPLPSENLEKQLDVQNEDNKGDADSKENAAEIYEQCDASDPLPSENLEKKLDVQNEDLDNKGDDDSKTIAEVGSEKCDASDLPSDDNIEKTLDNKVDVFPSHTENESEIFKSGEATESNVEDNKVDTAEPLKLEINEELHCDQDLASHEVQDLVLTFEDNFIDKISGDTEDTNELLKLESEEKSDAVEDVGLETFTSDAVEDVGLEKSDAVEDIADADMQNELLETRVDVVPSDVINEELNCDKNLESNEVQDLQLPSENTSGGKISEILKDSNEEASNEPIVDSMDFVESEKQVAVDYSLQKQDVLIREDSVRPTPVKKCSSKTPSKAEAMRTHVTDDKENVYKAKKENVDDSMDFVDVYTEEIKSDNKLELEKSLSKESEKQVAVDYSLQKQDMLIREDSVCPTSVKKCLSKTPSKAETEAMTTHVTDDKENVDDEKNALHKASLRQLAKMLKEKLQGTKGMKNVEETNIAKMTKARPALQLLPENRLVTEKLKSEN